MNVKELEKRYLMLIKEVDNLKQINSILLQGGENKLLEQISYLKLINERLLKENIELKEQVLKYNSKKRKYNKRSIEERQIEKKYKQFRQEILKRDNFTCQECGSKYRLQVHHIKSRKDYPELIMDKDNCITLCISCHSKTENFFVS